MSECTYLVLTFGLMFGAMLLMLFAIFKPWNNDLNHRINESEKMKKNQREQKNSQTFECCVGCIGYGKRIVDNSGFGIIWANCYQKKGCKISSERSIKW